MAHFSLRKHWSSRFEKWLNRRIPASRNFNLDQSNIFIFPSYFGILFVILCLTLFILGSNYQNNLMLLLCYFLVALFLSNLFTSFVNFARLSVKLGKVKPVFAEEDISVPLWLNDGQSQQISGAIHVKFWGQKNAQIIEPTVVTNPMELVLPSLPRGAHSLPRVTIESFYPLGIYRCWTHLKFSQQILVYPKPKPCHLLLNMMDSSEGDENQTGSSGNDDFEALSSYIPGEPLNRVAWKQVAKGQGMMSKHFSGMQSKTLFLKLSELHEGDIEYKLSQLCFMVLELSKQDATFGLDLGVNAIQPGNGEQHLQICLTALTVYPETSVRAD